MEQFLEHSNIVPADTHLIGLSDKRECRIIEVLDFRVSVYLDHL